MYYRFPFTLGTIAFFEDRDAMMKFARSKHHRELMCWLVDNGAVEVIDRTRFAAAVPA